MELLKIENLTKVIKKKKILDDVSLTVNSGEIVGFFRITSYNVCYTKLLRGRARAAGKEQRGEHELPALFFAEQDVHVCVHP